MGTSTGTEWVKPPTHGCSTPRPPRCHQTHLAGVGAPRAEPGAEHVPGDAVGVELAALLVGDGVDHAALEDVGEVAWGRWDMVRGPRSSFAPWEGSPGGSDAMGPAPS